MNEIIRAVNNIIFMIGKYTELYVNKDIQLEEYVSLLSNCKLQLTKINESFYDKSIENKNKFQLVLKKLTKKEKSLNKTISGFIDKIDDMIDELFKYCDIKTAINRAIMINESYLGDNNGS